MRRNAATEAKAEQPQRTQRAKLALLWLAAVRTIAALVALGLLPVLYRHDFLVLVALRPSLGILLLACSQYILSGPQATTTSLRFLAFTVHRGLTGTPHYLFLALDRRVYEA